MELVAAGCGEQLRDAVEPGEPGESFTVIQ